MKPEKFLSCAFISVVMLFLSSICYHIAARGIYKISPHEDKKFISTNTVDLAKLYPFESNFDSAPAENTQFTQGGGGVLQRIYNFLKDKTISYTTEKLAGYDRIIENSRRYEEFIKWNIAYIPEYNPVVKLSDGYLTTFTQSSDVTQNALSTLELANFCDSLDIKFFYVNLPNKICVSQDKDVSGVLDFSNQNADRFLTLLDNYGVKYYDLRKNLHDQGMNHHEAFFRTDHHWKPESGLWAAGETLKILRDNYNWPVNPEILNPENFDYVIYRNWFLGSQGKKIKLVRTKPDDISLIYPKFETSFIYEIPTSAINKTGDFAIIYSMESIQTHDYYNLNSYAAYDYADQPLIKFTNLLTSCDKKLLVIHESFANCVLPFLALDIKNVAEIDLRHFTGSLRNYITSERPDIVIIMYYATVPGRSSKPDASKTDKKFFDFR